MDGEKFIDACIKSRRSIRNFLDNPVPTEVIKKIIEAGMFAPSALNRRPWKFIVITNRHLIKEFSKIATDRIKILYKFIFLLKLFVKDLKDQRAINALKKTAESRCDTDTIYYNAPLLILVANDTRYGNTECDSYLAAQNMMLAAYSLGVGSCFIGRGQVIPRKILLMKLGLPDYYDIKVHLVFGYPKDIPLSRPVEKREDMIMWL